MKISINTKEVTLLKELQEDHPEGVTIIEKPNQEITFDDINTTIDISFNIDVIIDVSKVTAIIAATWFANRVRSKPRITYVNVDMNGKHIPIYNPDTIKLIEKEINEKDNG